MELMPTETGASSSAPSHAYAAASMTDRQSLQRVREALAADDTLLERLQPFAAKYGGLDRCLLSYLRAGDVQYDVQKALARLRSSLDFRKSMGLDDITDAAAALNDHPLKDVWPVSFPLMAPNGCPVQYARCGAIRPSQLTKTTGGEASLKLAVALSLSRALELQAKVEKTRHCVGTYDVYDLQGASREHLELGALRTLGRCISLGTSHFPETLATCFIINAPKWATFGWSVVRPLINDRTRAKIIISNGVPDVLRQALGGEEALQRMLNSVPPTLPIPSHEVDAQVG